MSAGWRIVPASAAMAHLAGLARWHHAEWAALYVRWSEEEALAELRDSARIGATVPATLVALDDDEALLGSVSVVAEDSPDLVAFEGPWLASLYVAPAARGQGLGGALVRALVAHAAASGVPRLRLFTPNHRAFYERLGWRLEARSRAGGTGVDVMVIELTPPRATASVP